MIIDTNLHVTVDDKWDKKISSNKFKKILEIYKKYKLKGFCAVGIPNVGKYNHSDFLKKISKFKFIHPVAGLNLKKNIEKEFKEIHMLGYRSVKIHPRSCNSNFNNIDTDKITFFLKKYKFNVLLCTYFNQKIENTYSEDPKISIIKLIKKLNNNNKVVLMHGGCERIMEFAELIRFDDNIYLDLSLTIMKYENSSIDKDIKYLFQHYDRKITLGSDFPEVNYKYFINRRRLFSKGISNDKKNNIFFKNAKKIFF